MEPDQVWQEFLSLPLEAQRQVSDFISFLKTRYPASAVGQETATKTSLADDPFIGLWRDRTDLDDSTTWVRQTRQREWGRQP